MPGVTIARWTMSYFARALLCLLGAGSIMVAGFWARASRRRKLWFLLAAIGWFSLLMCGALSHFVPALVARRLHSDALALPAIEPRMLVSVALAHKMARMVWALLTRKENYRAPTAVAV